MYKIGNIIKQKVNILDKKIINHNTYLLFYPSLML